MMQQDSIYNALPATATDSSAVTVHPHRLTPAEVMGWLPKDATPAQLDSAVQRYIKPSEIHWSQQPDTLRLPGQELYKSIYDPFGDYDYRDTYLPKANFTHAELEADRTGAAGDPVPYTSANDNLITGLLLLFFVVSMIAIRWTKNLFVRHLRSFLYASHGEKTLTETATEFRSQLFLILQTCVLFGLVYFFYAQGDHTAEFVIPTYAVFGIFIGIFIAFFLTELFLFGIVHWTFFDGKKNEQWNSSFIFLVAIEGLLLYPVVLLQTYFGISVKTTCLYALSVAILFKMLTLYKSCQIFFRKKEDFLTIFLYLCALEAIPMALLWNFLRITSQLLKVNY